MFEYVKKNQKACSFHPKGAFCNISKPIKGGSDHSQENGCGVRIGGCATSYSTAMESWEKVGRVNLALKHLQVTHLASIIKKRVKHQDVKHFQLV